VGVCHVLARVQLKADLPVRPRELSIHDTCHAPDPLTFGLSERATLDFTIDAKVEGSIHIVHRERVRSDPNLPVQPVLASMKPWNGVSMTSMRATCRSGATPTC
jgi:hypothetical protein